jgi:hypothetical protein
MEHILFCSLSSVVPATKRIVLMVTRHIEPMVIEHTELGFKPLVVERPGPKVVGLAGQLIQIIPFISIIF